MEQLIQYFMKHTDKRFDEVHEELGKLSEHLSDLTKFKIEMIASARTSAFLVSAVCGAITLISTVLTVIIMVKKP